MTDNKEKEFLIKQFRINLETVDRNKDYLLEYTTFKTTELSQILNTVDKELKSKEQLYNELFKLVESRILGDFCGYDEEKQEFDIILALKEILETKEQECEKLKEKVEKQQEFIDSTRTTGICEICTAKCITKNTQYRIALDKIEDYTRALYMILPHQQIEDAGNDSEKIIQMIITIIREAKNADTGI